MATHFTQTSLEVNKKWVSGYCNFAGVGCAEKYYFWWVFFLWLKIGDHKPEFHFLVFFLLLEYVGTVPENLQWHTKCHQTMVRLSLSGGIWSHWLRNGMVLPPWQKDKGQFAKRQEEQLTGVLVVGEGKWHVNRKEHMH